MTQIDEYLIVGNKKYKCEDVQRIFDDRIQGYDLDELYVEPMSEDIVETETVVEDIVSTDLSETEVE